jgi:hypothetical protein
LIDASALGIRFGTSLCDVEIPCFQFEACVD